MLVTVNCWKNSSPYSGDRIDPTMASMFTSGTNCNADSRATFDLAYWSYLNFWKSKHTKQSNSTVSFIKSVTWGNRVLRIKKRRVRKSVSSTVKNPWRKLKLLPGRHACFGREIGGSSLMCRLCPYQSTNKNHVNTKFHNYYWHKTLTIVIFLKPVRTSPFKSSHPIPPAPTTKTFAFFIFSAKSGERGPQ